MSFLPARTHGYLDYGTVVGFALAPALLGLEGLPKMICYGLAGVHLLLTLVTDFPLGSATLIPFKIHGLIELIVSIVLVVLPWVLGFAATPAARNFFIAAGVIIFLVWRLTNYKAGLS
jgi:hypothetical protein